MREISLASAARLGVAVEAAENGDNALMIDMIMSIPSEELDAAVARLELLHLPALKAFLAQ